jgi:hypothetical protein
MRNEKKHGTDAMRAWPVSPTARRPGKACLGMAGLFWLGLRVFAYFCSKKL